MKNKLIMVFIYCILCGQIQGFNNSITTIMCVKLVVIELWLGSYRMLE